MWDEIYNKWTQDMGHEINEIWNKVPVNEMNWIHKANAAIQISFAWFDIKPFTFDNATLCP